MIVLTSDHGDYLGDHWLGEKNFFHECSVKIPMLVYDPSSAADGTRGTTSDALVEAIDLAATFVAATGAEVPNHVIEGRSLLPILHGETPDDWRDAVICEFDYSTTPMAAKLGVAHEDARLFMVFDGRYKLIHAEGGFRPMLFDLQADPNEFTDLGASPEHRAIVDALYVRLGAWARRLSQRTALSDREVTAMTGKTARRGVLLGVYDGTEVPEELLAPLRGRAPARYCPD